MKKIYDKDGTSVPVKTEATANASTSTNDITNADLAYLEVTASGGVGDNIVATTVADTTFLINKTTDVLKATANGEVSGEGTSDLGSTQHLSSSGSVNITGDVDYEGLVYVKTGDYSSKFVAKLVIDLPSAGSPTTYKVEGPGSTSA